MRNILVAHPPQLAYQVGKFYQVCKALLNCNHLDVRPIYLHEFVNLVIGNRYLQWIQLELDPLKQI